MRFQCRRRHVTISSHTSFAYYVNVCMFCILRFSTHVQPNYIMTLVGFSTFAMVDKHGTCMAVTVYNLASGHGVKIGDAVAIPEPWMEHVQFKYQDHVRDFAYQLPGSSL